MNKRIVICADGTWNRPEKNPKKHDTEFWKLIALAKDFIRKNGSIKNSQLRELSGLDYDEATSFFNEAVKRGVLVRQGRTSGTSYIIHPEGEEKR